MKIKKSFIFLGVLLMLLSIASAVKAYEVDSNVYRLQISTVSVEDKNTVKFYLINPISDGYSFFDMHSYSITYRGTKTTTKFSHSPTGEYPVQGVLGFGAIKQFSLPYDRTNTVYYDLECGRDLVIEMFDLRGNVVARWVGIPRCNVVYPRVQGLLKVNNCTSEYYDGTLKIKWELLGADAAKGAVKLRKTVGRQDAVTGWYDASLCPDLVAGKCLTVVSPLFFGDGNVSVTLYDKRKGTSVTLSSTTGSGSCYKTATTVVTTTSSAAAKATSSASTKTQTAASTSTKAATTATKSTAGNASTNVALLKANDSKNAGICNKGCSAAGQCYATGTRVLYLGMNAYCAGTDWMVQKADGSVCKADHECSVNKCDSGYCGSKPKSVAKKGNWLYRMLLWMDNLI